MKEVYKTNLLFAQIIGVERAFVLSEKNDCQKGIKHLARTRKASSSLNHNSHIRHYYITILPFQLKVQVSAK